MSRLLKRAALFAGTACSLFGCSEVERLKLRSAMVDESRAITFIKSENDTLRYQIVSGDEVARANPYSGEKFGAITVEYADENKQDVSSISVIDNGEFRLVEGLSDETLEQFGHDIERVGKVYESRIEDTVNYRLYQIKRIQELKPFQN